MTPKDNYKFKTDAQARSMLLNAAPDGEGRRFDTEHYCEGYAAKYEAYLLYEDDAGKVYERFAPGCFNDTDMSDVIMQYDHAGRVFARTTNGTLIVEPDDVGLFMAADLSKTDRAKDLHADIMAGMITKMSWRFRVGDYHVEHAECSHDITIVHTRVPKIFDVSAVSIPANDNTEINARSWADGVIGEAVRSEIERGEEIRRRKLKLKISILEELNK